MLVEYEPAVARRLADVAVARGDTVDEVLSRAVALLVAVEQWKREGARVALVAEHADGRRVRVPL